MWSLALLIAGIIFPINTLAISAYAKFDSAPEGYFTFNQKPDNSTTVDVSLVKLFSNYNGYEFSNALCGTQENSYIGADHTEDLKGEISHEDSYVESSSSIKSVRIIGKNGEESNCANITLGSRVVGYALFDRSDIGLNGLFTLTQYGDLSVLIEVDLIGDAILDKKAQRFFFAADDCGSRYYTGEDLQENAFFLHDNHYVHSYSIDGKDMTISDVGYINIIYGDGTSACSKLERSWIFPETYIYAKGPDGVEVTYWADEGKNWMPAVLFIYIAIVLLGIASWGFYRRGKDKNPSGSVLSRESFKRSSYNIIATEEEGMEVKEGIEMKNKKEFNIEVDNSMKTYALKSHIFGTIAFYLMNSFSVMTFVSYFTLVFSYYWGCEFNSIDSMCLYGSYPLFGYTLNSEIFFALWCVFLVWFGALLAVKKNMKIFYLIPCSFDDAEFIKVVTKEEAAEVATLYPSAVVMKVREWKEKWFKNAAENYITETVPVDTIDVNGKSVRYFTFRCTRFIFRKGNFCKFRPNIGNTIDEILKNTPLTAEEAAKRLALVGPNTIPFCVDPCGTAILNEFYRGFYLYQLLIYAVWLWWGYMFVGLVMLFIVMLSAFATVLIVRKNQKQIKTLTDYSVDVEVKRDDKWETICSTDLVPGDITKIQNDYILPCDVALFEGTAICDESGLTGESRPVRKSPLITSEKPYDSHACSKHTLFAGTRILQAGKDQNSLVYGLVVETGTTTSKGELVTHILFPRKMLFKYDEELPAALGLLFMYALVAFAMVNVCLAVNGSKKVFITVFNYGIFTISQVLSPLVPIALVVGQTMSATRLENMGVFCINPKRIPVAGKVRAYCFDKTGTLTKDGLDFIGVHECKTGSSGPVFKDRPCQVSNLSEKLVHGLATCHAVTQFGSKLVGNEVEVNMFEATKWELREENGKSPRVSPANGSPLEIVKRFEFDHKRMTMSVIVKDSDNRVHVFCKGASENIGARSIEATLPDDYDRISKKHAMEGCYVISIAHRDLGVLDDEAIGNMSRDDTEQQLHWLGLILFRNELKPCTADAIRDLKAGFVRCAMITGDNAQCGWYISRKSGLVSEDATVLLGDITSDGSIEWREMTTEKEPSGPFTTDEILDGHEKAELAVTGKAFMALEKDNILSQLILRLRIMARMSPDGKVLAVEKLIAKGLIVGMCGDGGNDCGALRSAHVGLALSEAEASVVSPFTSKTKSIRSVVDILREGRGALATSFAQYKFLITYGQLFSVVKLCCLGLGVILCNMDYIYFDAVIVMFMSYTMTLSHPRDILQKQRPTSSLVGPVTVGGLVGMQVIHMTMLGIGLGIIINHRYYVRWPARLSSAGAYWFLSDNWECTVLFIMFAGQFLNSAMTFSMGSYYRKPIYRNYWLCFTWFVGYLILTLAMLLPDGPFPRLFHMSSHQDNKPHTENPIWKEWQAEGGSTSPAMPFSLRLGLWLLMTLGSVLSALWEKFVILGPGADYFRKKNPSIRPTFPTGH